MSHIKFSYFYRDHLHLRCVFQNICDKCDKKDSKHKDSSRAISWFCSIYTYLLILVTLCPFSVRMCSCYICNTVSNSVSVAVSFSCILNKKNMEKAFFQNAPF